MDNTSTSHTINTKPIAYWLFFCCGLVFTMVIIGAITRLTESGLSIVEWRPLIGSLPPLNDTEWNRVFTLYQETPEFQQKNFWMSIEEFKSIFFWEWFHRLLGRMIGLAYALPLAWFWVRGAIPRGEHLKLFGLFLLGGAQGFMGWYMVKSGLVDRPDVSHYRLAAHLGLAFLIISLMFWQALKFIGIKKNPSPSLHGHSWITLCFLVITILWGAYVAGLEAGLVYNESFPKMGGQWIPPDMWSLEPAWLNFFENYGSVQFTHRWLAIFTTAMVLGLSIRAFIKKRRDIVFGALGGMVVIQFGLGIATLLSLVAIPLAVLHQAGALTLLLLMVACLYRTHGKA